MIIITHLTGYYQKCGAAILECGKSDCLKYIRNIPIITGLSFQKKKARFGANMVIPAKIFLSLVRIMNKPRCPFSGLPLVEDILLILAMPVCHCL